MFIDIHTHQFTPSTSKNKLAVFNCIAGKNEIIADTYFTYGYHPWYLPETFNSTEYINKISTKKCIGIGEIGLDKSKGANFELQKYFFIEQLKIAELLSKPIIIHHVKTYQLILELVKNFKFKLPVIFHGFLLKKEIAREIFQLTNTYLSLSYKGIEKTAYYINDLPLERIFFETDNYSQAIENTYQSFAQHIQKPIILLEKQIEKNFNSVFKL